MKSSVRTSRSAPRRPLRQRSARFVDVAGDVAHHGIELPDGDVQRGWLAHLGGLAGGGRCGNAGLGLTKGQRRRLLLRQVSIPGNNLKGKAKL
jgi:hypothetical protein